MKLRLFGIALLSFLFTFPALATKLLITMDADGQTNHLKAYGVAFAALKGGTKVDWLLNYKGGSFGMEYSKVLADMCKDRGVSCTKMKDNDYKAILTEVKNPKYDGDVVQLEKAPKIAVYTPLNKEPWDDAVTLALTYAEIPFDKLYADEVLRGDLSKYDWLHLHHEDFTGQYGKFWYQFRAQAWYQNDQQAAEHLAAKHGYKKVAQLQLAVVKKINAFVSAGGSLFAMCSATDTYDIALAADGVDICETQFDNDPMDPDAQKKLNFSNCLAFKDFTLVTSPYEYEYSNIDNTNFRKIAKEQDSFTIMHFPAKLDQVPAMLCQNHTTTIKGFMGQTTAFRNEVLKPQVLVMGECKAVGEARYIHGDYGKGSFTFYGGHDPEDYQHGVGAPPTNLAFHVASPGYRLILNNVLCHAAKKQDVATVTLTQKPAAATAATPQPVATEPAKPESHSRIQIAPDLANDEIILSMPGTKNGCNVIVSNTSGKQVINKNFPTSPVHLSLKDLTQGVYLIQVDGIYAGKVVKD